MATEGRNAASLQAFFDGLTDEQKASIRAVSIDMSAGYENAIRAPEGVPHAQVCFDPFHVVQLGGKACDQVRRDEYNKHGRSFTDTGKWIKGARYSLLKDTAKQTAEAAAQARRGRDHQQERCTARSCSTASCATSTSCPRKKRAERLDAWLAWASRSRLKPFIKLARTLRKHKAGVIAAVQLGIEQRTSRGAEQQGEIDLTPGLRIPLRRRTDRDDLPLLRRHHGSRSLTDESPPNGEESPFSGGIGPSLSK